MKTVQESELRSTRKDAELLRLRAVKRLKQWFKERAGTQPAEAEALSPDEVNSLVRE